MKNRVFLIVSVVFLLFTLLYVRSKMEPDISFALSKGNVPALGPLTIPTVTSLPLAIPPSVTLAEQFIRSKYDVQGELMATTSIHRFEHLQAELELVKFT